MPKLPIFITGNQSKADYLSKMLHIPLEHQSIDLDEIQSMNLEEIVEHKVRQAYRLVGRPVLVEDVALGFNALGGLPGPFVKFFTTAPNGLEKMCRMCDGLDNRKAEASCVFGYFDGRTVALIEGGLHGEIAMNPRGKNGFGWDRIFCPDGYGGKTRAELSRHDDERTYAMIKPLAKLHDFLINIDKV
ncbi:MAG TPA: non-canonical purine NTP pyrophosphatase [Candidatus Saccharibacteria bacterium]|nr:non-canonical purine NTP pyrophosphatase [Candidatus Saccharibacteria bacterium]HMR38683.1 non-canonical purine NTP pyrophosphatase [Candidatus Saccharibacteria bacterium]